MLNCALLWNVSVQFLVRLALSHPPEEQDKTQGGMLVFVSFFLVFRALDSTKSTLRYLSDSASLHRFSTQAPGYFLVEQKSYGYISKKSALGLCICVEAQRWKIFLYLRLQQGYSLSELIETPCIIHKLDFYLDSISSIYQLGSQTSRIAQTLAVYW